MKFPTAAAAAACRGRLLHSVDENISVCAKPSVSMLVARRGAVQLGGSWDPTIASSRPFCLSVEVQHHQSAMDGDKPLSETYSR